MSRDSEDSSINLVIIIAFAAALALHIIAGIFYEIYRRQHRDFISVPIEVSFYTPSAARATPVPVTPAPEPKKEPEKAKPQPKEKPVKNGEIAVKDKSKKPEPKPETKPEPEPQPTPKPAENTTQTTQPPSTQAAGSQYGGLTLDTQDFKYAYYTNSVVRAIGRNWQWSESYGRLRAVVFFRIHRDGSVTDIAVTESSGNPGYDANAVRAVQLSQLPPLPEDYDRDSLGVYFEFKYRN